MPAREPGGAGSVRVRLLRREELPAACRLASAAFRENRFYQQALGLDPRSFDAYWEAFLPLALADPAGRVFALEVPGELVGLLVATLGPFPSRRRGLGFLLSLLRRIGPRRFGRYLRFLGKYGAALHRSREEALLEVRGLWLLTAPGRGRFGWGTRLVRAAIEEGAAEGKSLFTGLCDFGNEPLVHFYRRAGFSIGPPFALGAGSAAVIELRPHRGGLLAAHGGLPPDPRGGRKAAPC
jgi:hypothetical protein